jgi:hypothetical protein
MKTLTAIGAFMLLGSGALGAPQTDNDPPEKKSLKDRFNVSVLFGSHQVGSRDYQVSPEKFGEWQRMDPDSVYSLQSLRGYKHHWVDMSHLGQESYGEMATYEAEKRRPWNQFNHGIGINYEVNKWMHAGVGIYKNSIHNASVYALVGAETNREKLVGVGVEFAAVTGYKDHAIPTATGYLRLAGKNDHLNLKICVRPPISEVTPTVISAQIRFNLGAFKKPLKVKDASTKSRPYRFFNQ